MLQVFESNKARDQVRLKQTKFRNGELYYLSGLTYPTVDIVTNRFEPSQVSMEATFDVNKVRSICEDIASTEDSKATTTKGGGGTNFLSNEIIEITEEIVDFEEWMVDKAATVAKLQTSSQLSASASLVGIKYVLEWSEDKDEIALGLALDHPEILAPLNTDGVYDRSIRVAPANKGAARNEP